MTKVEFRVLNAAGYAQVVREKLPFARIEGDVVVVPSQLAPDVVLNEHLVWLWGLLQHQRRVLRAAQEGGASLVFECVVPKGPLRLLANGVGPVHLLGAELRLTVK